MRVKFSDSYVSHYVVSMVLVPEYISFASIVRTFGYSVWIYIMVGFVVGLLLRMNQSRIDSLTVLQALFLEVSADLNLSRRYQSNDQLTTGKWSDTEMDEVRADRTRILQLVWMKLLEYLCFWLLVCC